MSLHIVVIIESRDAGADPLRAKGGIAVRRDTFALRDAVLKPSKIPAELFRHRGRAVVFSPIKEDRVRLDVSDLDLARDCILVRRICGFEVHPGMAEVGTMVLSRRLLEQANLDCNLNPAAASKPQSLQQVSQ